MTGEKDLLLMFANRDEQAISICEQKFGRLCRTVAFRILGDRQDAEECANDVLLKLWDSIPPAEPRSLTAFVSGITRNLALDRLSAKCADKRGGGQPAETLEELAPYLASDENLEDQVNEIALQDAVARFLRSIPKDSRMIFLARYYAMQTPQEIAEAHGATPGKIKMNLKRTREKLRVFLKEEGLI